jgi:acetyl-CoA carboxylase beta subunit
VSTPAWDPLAMARTCPYCHARPGIRCRTSSGKRASAPHEGRLGPILECPRCGLVTYGDELNVREGYCPQCQDWTAPGRGRAAQDVLTW